MKVKTGIFIGNSEKMNTLRKEKATRSGGKEFGTWSRISTLCY